MSKGTVYDHYDITEIIGEGTYSTVTVATQKENQEQYAIKIISKEILTNKQKREMVDWEISILSKCNHPNIVDFIEHFESDEDICLVLEWVPNGDLFDRIVKHGVFTEEQARLTMKSIISAVEYLHDKSLVHRDLKPENILFNNEQGDVKLADFGLSKHYDESQGMDSETSCGTPMYQPPEIVSNKTYRKGVDMWSVGCILYFILYGRPPFYSDDEETIQKLVTQGQWSFPDSDNNSNSVVVSDEVKNLIKSLLETDPNKRLTATQSLQHPWILGESMGSNNNNSNSESISSSKSSGSRIINTSNNSSSIRESLTKQQQTPDRIISISSNHGELSLRSSNTSNPIPIKQKALLRSSLNSSIECFRGNLTPN